MMAAYLVESLIKELRRVKSYQTYDRLVAEINKVGLAPPQAS